MSSSEISSLGLDILPTDWMHSNLTLLGNLTLRQLCIPGSHDAGMSVFGTCTGGAAPCNTITQTTRILGQLNNGARYFDVRPVISAGAYLTGHYSYIAHMTWQGANGQSIQSIVDDVNTFTATNQELVVLYLSHDEDTDEDNDDYAPFTQAQWDALLVELSGLNNLFSLPAATQQTDLTMMQLNEFIGGGAAVIVVVDYAQTDSPVISLGNYAFNGFYYASNFTVYNVYSDTNDCGSMISGQLREMQAQKPYPYNSYFLLSWTLTQSTRQVIACKSPIEPGPSILQLAHEAHEALYQNLLPACTDLCYPNIIYVDNVNSQKFALLAMSVNRMAISSAPPVGALTVFALENNVWTLSPLPSQPQATGVAVWESPGSLIISEVLSTQHLVMNFYWDGLEKYGYQDWSSSLKGSGPVAGNPVLFTGAQGNPDVYVQMNANVLGHFYWSGGLAQFENISAMPAVNTLVQGNPAIIADQQGDIGVLIQKAATAHLVMIYYDVSAGTWGFSQDMSTLHGSDVAAGSPVSSQSPESDVYVLMGGQLANHLGRFYYDSLWKFEDVSTSTSNPPAVTEVFGVCVDAAGVQNVFVLGSDSVVYQFWFESGSWTCSPVTSGQIVAGGLAIAVANGSILLFGRDNNGHLLQFSSSSYGVWNFTDVSTVTEQLIQTDPAVWTDGSAVQVYAVKSGVLGTTATSRS
jgi:hypothetical protein